MSNNLNLDQVAENQADKEVTINTATGQLDAALTERFTADVTAGNVTLTSSQYRRCLNIFIDNATVAGRDVILPAIKKLSIVTMDAGNTQPVDIVVGSTTLTIAVGAVVTIYTDGTTNGLIAVSTQATTTVSYDVGTFCAGAPGASEKLLRYAYVRSVDLPASLTGSVCKADTAATAQTDFDLRLNGASIGTIRFAAAGTVATYVGVSATSIAPGDILEIRAPGTPDITLADISFTLAGVKA